MTEGEKIRFKEVSTRVSDGSELVEGKELHSTQRRKRSRIVKHPRIMSTGGYRCTKCRHLSWLARNFYKSFLFFVMFKFWVTSYC